MYAVCWGLYFYIYKCIKVHNTLADVIEIKTFTQLNIWERSGSVVECLAGDRGPWVRASRVSLCCVLEQDTLINSLVPVQPRKTHPYITERLLMGRKESNQTKQLNILRAANTTNLTHRHGLFQARNLIFQMVQWRHCAAEIGMSSSARWSLC